jgi:hypothetical protein
MGGVHHGRGHRRADGATGRGALDLGAGRDGQLHGPGLCPARPGADDLPERSPPGGHARLHHASGARSRGASRARRQGEPDAGSRIRESLDCARRAARARGAARTRASRPAGGCRRPAGARPPAESGGPGGARSRDRAARSGRRHDSHGAAPDRRGRPRVPPVRGQVAPRVLRGAAGAAPHDLQGERRDPGSASARDGRLHGGRAGRGGRGAGGPDHRVRPRSGRADSAALAVLGCRC